MTDGDSASPEIEGETGFSAGCGLPADQVIAAVHELARTRTLPGGVPWKEA